MKINVGLFFGGKSTEHEVSVITGLQALSAIDKSKYDVVPIYITKENDFYIGDSIGKIHEYSDIPTLLNKSRRVTLINQSGWVGIYEFNKKGVLKVAKYTPNGSPAIDIALPAVHGTNVEDGALQGFFETLGLPYAGCDVLSSATGMDKFVTKAVLKQSAIPVLDCIPFTSKRFIEEKDDIINQVEAIGYPIIIKPINLGSSIGIKIAQNKDELIAAIEHALIFADRIIAEPAIANLKEVNCAVLGDKDYAEASECEEPVSYDGILDFEDKYCSSSGEKSAKSVKTGDAGGMVSLKRKIPAGISGSQREEIRTLAVKAFKSLGCCGVARIDFLIDTQSEKVWFNEINTIPGSLSFYLWESVGINYPQLLDKMISLALKREREKSNLAYSFNSNILAGFKNRIGVKGSKI